MYKCQIRVMNMFLILFSFLLLKLSSFFWTILPSFHPCFGLQCVIVRVRERAGYWRISGGRGGVQMQEGGLEALEIYFKNG